MRTLSGLTRQEHRILELVARGWRNSTIAQELFISTRTVETHLYHIFHKLGVSSRTEAALYVLSANSLLMPEISGIADDRVARNS
jgi:DNA-binding NarL/FixJ family response regulator